MPNKFSAVKIRSGQNAPYDHTYHVWDVQTTATEEETRTWCFANLSRKTLPEEAEWNKNIMYKGAKRGDMSYYFTGWYEMHPIDGGYRFTRCEPYCD